MYASRNSRNARNSKPPESPLAFLFEDFRQKLNHLLPRPDSSNLHHPPPSPANCGTAETVEIFRAVGVGFARLGVTRDALEGRKGPHFRYWSLIAIFECHVCAQRGERAADRAAQRRKRGRPRGSESRLRLPRRSWPSTFWSRCGPGLDPGLRPGAWHPVAGRCFPCAYGEPESPTSPPTRPKSRARHGAMTIETARRASLEFVCVFGQNALGGPARRSVKTVLSSWASN